MNPAAPQRELAAALEHCAARRRQVRSPAARAAAPERRELRVLDAMERVEPAAVSCASKIRTAFERHHSADPFRCRRRHGHEERPITGDVGKRRLKRGLKNPPCSTESASAATM